MSNDRQQIEAPAEGDRLPMGTRPPAWGRPGGATAERSAGAHNAGLLILNADDWGRDRENTDRTLECVDRGTVTSVSAMVFMEDSERAAAIARDRGIDAGLHLNFTTPFTVPGAPRQLLEQQERLSRFLRRHRFAPVVFHPGLAGYFEGVLAAQRDEYCRLYGGEPTRLDGHHHMHLCSNVLLGGLLPAGTLVRRNFSFEPGEKGLANRYYRKAVDRLLSRRHGMVDFFFSLPPFEPRGRLERIRSLARRFAVEVETHPVKADEYRFLTGSEVDRWTEDVPIARRFTFPGRTCAIVHGEKA